MDRLTDHDVAQVLRDNIAGLSVAGIEPSISDLRYIKLSDYEDEQEIKEKRFVSYDPDEWVE